MSSWSSTIDDQGENLDAEDDFEFEENNVYYIILLKLSSINQLNN